MVKLRQVRFGGSLRQVRFGGQMQPTVEMIERLTREQVNDELQVRSGMRLREILQSGQAVSGWSGIALIQEVMTRLRPWTGRLLPFYVVRAPMGLLNGSLSGWNAESLPDGTLVFNYDLVRASWAVAEGYSRHLADPSFDINAHCDQIIYTLTHGLTLLPDADPLRHFGAQTTSVFRNMIAFVAAHELAHYAMHHAVKKTVEGRSGDATEASFAHFTRLTEVEADIYGAEMLAQTQAYDLRGALLSLWFMSLLEEQSGHLPAPSDTHPAARDRYYTLQNWLAKRKLPVNL